MYCPTCGQEQLAENVRFCSRCGFLLTGVSEVIANNGLIPNNSVSDEEMPVDSPRKKGLKQGLMILLVGILLILPIMALIHLATNTEPYLVAITAIISFWGGILRMIYAVMYESKYPTNKSLEQNNKNKGILGKKANQNALPPQQSIPVNDYVSPGSWRTTNDLQPPSITDNTTKLLEKEEETK